MFFNYNFSSEGSRILDEEYFTNKNIYIKKFVILIYKQKLLNFFLAFLVTIPPAIPSIDT